MHPAVYLAVINARETPLRAERHHERPVRKLRTRFPARIAGAARRLRAA
jgi:hypothetical protein